jgi:hypothetical protein
MGKYRRRRSRCNHRERLGAVTASGQPRPSLFCPFRPPRKDLFENDDEVSRSVAAITPDAQNYPSVGQAIDDKWQVTDGISPDSEDRCLRVRWLGNSE